MALLELPKKYLMQNGKVSEANLDALREFLGAKYKTRTCFWWTLTVILDNNALQEEFFFGGKKDPPPWEKIKGQN